MIAYVVRFGDVDKSDVARAGGKGANLGEMTRAGFPVPPGFCVTTDAFHAFLVTAGAGALYAALDDAKDDVERVRDAAGKMRAHLTALPVPPAIAAAVIDAWRALGVEHAYAVRSSATAEDLPGASFAGQQDTYLNVVGEAALLDRLRACWASLFTDRAVVYRAKNGFDHKKVALCVVVQRQILPEVSGIMFTADPVDQRRHIVSIDAGFGLGEALVSGLVNADLVKVDKRSGAVVEEKIGDKKVAIMPRPGTAGGTVQVEVGEDKRRARVLDDAQVTALVDVGVRIEQHYGAPQDIEWCFAGGALYIVQARPITTIFPTPRAGVADVDDDGLHIYLSFGHAQVMTDAMPPFSISLWRRLFPFGRPPGGLSSIFAQAGGRIYLDPTPLLRVPRVGPRITNVLRAADPTIAASVAEAAARPAFVATIGHGRGHPGRTLFGMMRRILPRLALRLLFGAPESAAVRATAFLDDNWRAMRAKLDAVTDPAARLAAVDAAFETMFLEVIIRFAPFVAGGVLSAVLVRKLARASAEDLAALGRGLIGNVTTEMDMRLGDVADVARASPALSARFRSGEIPTLAEAKALDPAFAAAIDAFLAEYGVRGASEIDVSRPRFVDDPRALLTVIKGALTRESAGEHRSHHARLKSEGEAAMTRIVASASWPKRGLVRRFARVHRAFMAMREHPKLQLVRYFALARRAALDAGAVLVERQALERADDVWMLTLPELRALLAGTAGDWRALVANRRTDFARAQKLSPPRVITSEGEIVAAKSTQQLPAGALGGTAASSGVVEGVAHVVFDPATAVLHAGEILVAPFTDPGWTPLFINAAALVMEVGGLMTHGSVVAREYGIPAVVSVDSATKRIKTGQRIRVDGTNGIVTFI